MTDAPKQILGSGGGGRRSPPPPPQPTREPDTLHSRQFATFLDLISEGEIEGFATASKEGRTQGTTAYTNAALKDVFLNDTPVLRSTANSANPQTSDFNFQNVGFTPRFGTGDQTKIPGIENSVSTTTVNVTVTASTPVTRQITNTNVDAAKVSITFSQLQKATDEGDLLGAEVQLQIAVQYNSGGFSTVITDTIKGRSGDAYQKDYRVNITGSFPVDIRVSRVTPDAADTNLQDTFEWTSIGEIIDDDSRYLNSAYNSIRLDSMQFSSIPSRKFRVRGIKVRIPGAGASGSGTPSIDSSTGRIVYPTGYIFNGVMGAAQWCSCPAMILLDVLTNTRYGFGDHITDSSLDLFSFVNASKFANTLVDDGAGGQEARFSCNVNIQTPTEAFELINSLAGVMRCMPIWSAGSITITQDKPTDPSYLFNLSNVSESGFSYSGSSLKTRHTVVSVSYFNMDSQEIDFEVVEDSTLKSKLGTVVKQVKAFACTSRNQARRLGRAILFAENNESEICNFTTSIDSGVVVRPGAVIQINDPVRAGVRRGGRVRSATTKRITVDDSSATDLVASNSATLSVILPDGTFETRDVAYAGTTAATYVQSGTTIDINLNNHNFSVGDQVTLDFTSGGTASPNGLYTIATEDGDDNFTVTSSVSDSASGNVNVSIGAGSTTTYSQTGTTVTITLNNHGLKVGERVTLTFTSGGTNTADGVYIVATEDGDDTFTITSATSDTASGNVIVVLDIEVGNLITVTQAFSQTPNVNTVWLLENTTVEAQLFRVINVEEQDGLTYAITALSYVEGKYAFIEDGTALPTRTTSNLTDLTDPPGGLTATERIFPINNQAISKLIISWQPIVGVVEYQVNYRFENGNFVSEKVSRPDLEVINSRKGTYEIQVFSYNILGQLSATSNNITFEAVGKTALPQDVTNLLLEPVSDQFVRLRFDKATDIDVTHGGNVVVRHSNLTDGTGTFTNSVDIIPALPGNVSETLVPAVDGEYILKFRDDGGRLSSGETSVVVTTPDPLPKLSVFVDREDTAFPGAKVDTFLDTATLNGLVLGSATKIDSVTSVDDVPSFDFLGDIASSGTYAFEDPLDLGSKQPIRLTRHFVTESFYPNDLIDSRTALVDLWTDIDAVTAFNTNARLLVATTDSDPSATSSATYSQSGTTITITKSNHGFAIGSLIDITFTTGSTTSDNGEYQIVSKPSDDTFTVTSTVSDTASGNCTLGSEFTVFSTMANGTFIGRGFKFKVELTSSDPAQSIIVKQVGYSASLERRTETPVNVIASGTSQKSVTFINNFFTGASGTSVGAGTALPTIGITIENMQSGDFFELSSISATGFNIDIKNGSSHVNRNFKYTAVGFGRGS